MEATATELSRQVKERVDSLIAAARERDIDCVDLSAVDTLAQELNLDDEDARAIQERIESRGLDVRDDCGQDAEPQGYRNPELAEQTTDALQLFFNEVRRHPLLTKDEEVELAKGVERGDLEAKERMINSNLRLVVSNARRYMRQDLNLLDLIQEGILGLIRASEKFDWRKGYKFSTYATFWIREAIQRGIANKGRTIRIPVHIGQRERKIARATQKLATDLGRDPTDEEIAAETELPIEQVIEVKDAARTVTSLDRPVGEGEETSFGDLLPGDAPTPDEEVEIGFREDILHRALEKLPEQERKVVKLRYGINGDNPTPLREAGQMLGMSAEGVRKLEKRALERLAQQREIEGLRDAA